MRNLRYWMIRAVMLATALVGMTACVAYEPAPRYGYYDGPGYYAYPHAYYYGGYYRERWH